MVIHWCYQSSHCTPHAPLRKLRKTVHSKLLINLCFALLGLYVTFIISTVSTGVPVLCGVVSALMHYFFLAVFFWMAAEAIQLHRKLVSVFKPDIKNYALIAMAICWGRLMHAYRETFQTNSTPALLYIKCLCAFPLPFYSCSCIHCDLLLSSILPQLHPPTIVRNINSYIVLFNIQTFQFTTLVFISFFSNLQLPCSWLFFLDRPTGPLWRHLHNELGHIHPHFW